ncbi:MAG: DUF177 domain-containing protein [Stellaceae bacterium]
MSASAPEFSRLVSLARLGSEPFRQDIEATAEERERLVRRFGLMSLDRFTAAVALHREGGGLIRLEAEIVAEFAQECVVTLEPVAGKIAQSFALVYGPAEDGPAEIDLDDAEAPAFEPLTGDAIDIGEAVAQELSLALPEFPRDPDAVLDPAAIEEAPGGSFAALAKLRQPLQQ